MTSETNAEPKKPTAKNLEAGESGKTEPVDVLFIDNFDSFTFNLVDEFARREARVHTWRNDITAEQALAVAEDLPGARLIVLSPGPGAPADAGCCVELVRKVVAMPEPIPLLGICLGHQAIVEALGGTVGPAGCIVHGKTSRVEHDGSGLFQDLPNPLTVGRYHSLAAQQLPDSLTTAGRFSDSRAGKPVMELVMAVRHKTAPLAGLQFHPESILTPQGGRLLENALAWASRTSGKGNSANANSGEEGENER